MLIHPLYYQRPDHNAFSLPPGRALIGGFCFFSRPAAQSLPTAFTAEFLLRPRPLPIPPRPRPPLCSLVLPLVHLLAPPRRTGSASASPGPAPGSSSTSPALGPAWGLRGREPRVVQLRGTALRDRPVPHSSRRRRALPPSKCLPSRSGA